MKFHFNQTPRRPSDPRAVIVYVVILVLCGSIAAGIWIAGNVSEGLAVIAIGVALCFVIGALTWKG